MARHSWNCVAALSVCISCLTCQASAYEYFVGFNFFWAPEPAAVWYEGYKGNVDSLMASAQRLGQKVVRTWAINKGLPTGPGQYDESQFKGLDYVVASAGRYGVRLILNLGDYWPPFVGPGAWMAWAGEGATGSPNIAFYGSTAARELYKKHIDTVVNRKNSITGVMYKDDSAVMGYDVINEPRCPGCDSSQSAARYSWLTEMAAHLHSAAPNQVVFSGTEGYFQGDLVKYNPGYGSQCEGEDWKADNSIPNIQVATAHLYFNEVWGPMQLGRRKLTMGEYLNFIVQKIDVHTDVAYQIGKPWIIEEFGEPYYDVNEHHDNEDRKMLYAVVYEKLIAAKMAGKPFIGAMFWNASVGSQTTPDQINIPVDRTPSHPITLGSNVKGVGGSASGGASTGGGQSPSPASSSLGKRRMLLAQQLVAGARQVMQDGAARRLSAAGQSDGGQAARSSCAAAAINTWMSLPTNLVDVDYYRSLVAGHDVLDIVVAAAHVINGG